MPAQQYADHRCDYGRTSTTSDEGTCGQPAVYLGVDVYTHGRIEEPLCTDHIKARVDEHMTRGHVASWLTWRMEPLANIWPAAGELPKPMIMVVDECHAYASRADVPALV